jgi:hypothetical protein
MGDHRIHEVKRSVDGAPLVPREEGDAMVAPRHAVMASAKPFRSATVIISAKDPMGANKLEGWVEARSRLRFYDPYWAPSRSEPQPTFEDNAATRAPPLKSDSWWVADGSTADSGATMASPSSRGTRGAPSTLRLTS